MTHAAQRAGARRRRRNPGRRSAPAGAARSGTRRSATQAHPAGSTPKTSKASPPAASGCAVRRETKRRSSRWTAIILVLVAFNVALVGARNEVVRFLPQTASLFSAIGLPVNLRHLQFENVRISKATARRRQHADRRRHHRQHRRQRRPKCRACALPRATPVRPGNLYLDRAADRAAFSSRERN